MDEKRKNRVVATLATALLLAVLLASPTGTAAVLPGPTIRLAPTFDTPDPTFGDGGQWGVPTARLHPLNGWGYVTTLPTSTTITSATGTPDPAGPSHQVALNAAHKHLRGDAPVWQSDTTTGDLQRGDRVLAVNGKVPTARPGPGTWLIANNTGFHTITVNDTTNISWSLRQNVDIDTPAFPINAIGTSGSLATALAWIDALTPGDLTFGQTIAITGEVTPRGEVRPVNHIHEKQQGAHDSGYDLFLHAPAPTLAETITHLKSHAASNK